MGLCGRTGMEAGECRVQEITSLCIRIRRSLEGSSLTWLRWLWKNHGTLRSCLLLSPPGLGKTTLLSDAALQLARGFDGYPPLNVGVVDERGEFRTDAHLACCDVLSGTDKPRGILWLLRSMSPQVIVVDEIGSMEDAAALADAARSGVVLLASAHAQDFSALSSRAVLEPLRAYFPCRVLLGKSPGQIVGFEEEP